MRYSKQRELILNAVLENKIHPTADNVYNMLKEEHPELSLGTVYRNLNFFAENKMLLKISVPGGSDRFDGTTAAHHHLICEKCGNVYDIDAPEFNDFAGRVFRKTGFEVKSCSLAFKGICKNCKDDK